MDIRRHAHGWLTALLVMAVAACGGAGEDGGTTAGVRHEEDRALASATAGTVIAEAEEVRLVRGARAVPGFAGARVTIESPAEGAAGPVDAVDVILGAERFEPGAMTEGAESRGIAVSGQGQHVHLIIDHEPYRAIYDLSEPVHIEGIAPGAHVLFAFPSRAWHESVKSDGALAVRRFTTGEGAAAGGPAADFDPAAPFLVYSRPKGTYAGADADSVMVDFYLGNAALGPDDHTVRLTVDDGLEAHLTAWVPHLLVGLAAGEHRLRLELLDASGTPVGGSFGRAEATILVER